jgi:uncharacterized YccA/Bax inhibitor family protein
MRTQNPALSEATYEKWTAAAGANAGVMTVQGTIYKSLTLVGLVMATFIWTWLQFKGAGDAAAGRAAIMPYMLGGLIGGLVLFFITIFAAKASPITAPLYALCEGIVLGGISAMVEIKLPGIVFQAVGLTFGVFLSMLLLYTSRTIRATPALTRGVVVATCGIAVIYLISMAMSFFGGAPLPFIHSAGPIGIIFSLVVVGIAAFNLILDFDLVEQGAAAQAPKFMEWYAGFSLLVTLVWLYIEILRLLSKLRSK